MEWTKQRVDCEGTRVSQQTTNGRGREARGTIQSIATLYAAQCHNPQKVANFYKQKWQVPSNYLDGPELWQTLFFSRVSFFKKGKGNFFPCLRREVISVKPLLWTQRRPLLQLCKMETNTQTIFKGVAYEPLSHWIVHLLSWYFIMFCEEPWCGVFACREKTHTSSTAVV